MGVPHVLQKLPLTADAEQERLAALRALHILDTDAEQAYDDITRQAAWICDTPIALISLVEEDRQWFKSRVGLDVCETSRGVSFCSHAIKQPGILLVPDAQQDPRFADNPLVTGEPYIRFYAGVPLITAEGQALGSLCVIDTQPRTLSPEQQEAMTALARMVVTHLELRRKTAEQEWMLRENANIVADLRRSERRGRAILSAALDPVITISAAGCVTEWNSAAEETFGWTRAEAFGRKLSTLIIPERLRTAHEQGMAHYFATGEGPVLNMRIEVPAQRRDGTEFPIELTIVPIEDGGEAAFTAFLRDLSVRKNVEERLRLLAAALENANDVILITEAEPFDMPGPRVVYVNEAFTRTTGYTPEEILGRTPRILQGPDTDPETCAYLRRKLQAWETIKVELLNYRKDGTTFWSELHIRPIADENGWYTHWISVQRDVTERHHAAEAERADAQRRVGELTQNLHENEERLSLIYNTVSDLIFLVELGPDGSKRYLSVNAAYLAQTGLSEKDIIGKDVRDNLPEPALSKVLAHYEHAISTEQPVHYEMQVRFPAGLVQLETTMTPIRDESGRWRYMLGTCRDVSARKALEADQERQLAEALERADRDPLTGLLNHRAFQKRLEEEADRAQRENGTLAVAIIDLDNFKFFNDAYGHAAGDSVLRQVADVLRLSCRSYDVLARFGGDEFVLLLPGRTASAAPITGLAERLAQIGYQPPNSETAIPIGATIGIAVFPEEAVTRADIVELADQRLRRAKAGAGETEDLIARLRARLPASSAKGFAMLSALVTAVDTKDRYTRRHSEDVLAYSLQIAVGLGLDEDTRQAISVAALLHDVGKVGVPDAILRKPGRLSDSEFKAIQQHPVMGAAIVGAVPGFEDTMDAVRHHHERWDGGGYPGGLRGEETPLMARLMAVADAFSAMTTDRPYRKGMAEAKALSILHDGAGTQWDPACVAAFLQTRQAASLTHG